MNVALVNKKLEIDLLTEFPGSIKITDRRSLITCILIDYHARKLENPACEIQNDRSACKT